MTIYNPLLTRCVCVCVYFFFFLTFLNQSLEKIHLESKLDFAFVTFHTN